MPSPNFLRFPLEFLFCGRKQPKEPKQPKAEKVKTAHDAIDLISETEDSIDEVIYSTRTLSIEEILKAEAEQNKRRKGGR